MPERSTLGKSGLIHPRSAWNGNTAKFAVRGFSEVRPEDVPAEYHSFGGCTSRYKPVGYFRDVARSGVFAPVKEAMAMRDGHLMRRAGREFAKNLLWTAGAFGILAAIVVASTSLPLVGAMAFVGTAAAAAAVLAAIWTALVLVTETPIGGGAAHHPGWSPGPGRDRGGWDGGGAGDGGGGGG